MQTAARQHECTRTVPAVLLTLLVFFVALGSPAVAAHDADQSVRHTTARAAERLIFECEPISAHRTGFALRKTTFAVIGEPERDNHDYKALIDAAKSAVPIPASRVPELLAGLDRAYLRGRTITVIDEDGEEYLHVLFGPYRTQSGVVVTSADASNDHTARRRHSNSLLDDYRIESFANMSVANSRLLVGVRIHGSRADAEERIQLVRMIGLHESTEPLIESRTNFLEDGQAMVVIGEYPSDTYGMPVRMIVVVECRRVTAEDLNYAMIEYDADTEFAGLLSLIRSGDAMTEGDGYRDTLMIAALDAYRRGQLRLLSTGRARRGFEGWRDHSQESRRAMLGWLIPFAIVRSDAQGESVLQLDLGLGEGPQQIEIPELTRIKVRKNQGVAHKGSPTGDLRVLLTGSDGDRHRAMLCLHIGEYSLD